MVIPRSVMNMAKSLTQKVEMTLMVKFQKKPHMPNCISLADDFSSSMFFYHEPHFPFVFQTLAHGQILPIRLLVTLRDSCTSVKHCITLSMSNN